MGRSTNFCLMSIFINVCLMLLPLHCTKRNTETSDNDYNETDSSSKDVANKFESLVNLQSTYGMLTECTTPNRESAYCVPIQECQPLLEQWNNASTTAFFNASRCGPENEDRRYPKVCCGKFDNFKTVIFVKNQDIFPSSCGQQKVVVGSRIIGGLKTSLGEYPWMARVIYKNQLGYRVPKCAGFLIHDKIVVTAAHCTHPKSITIGKIVSVALGVYDTAANTSCYPDGSSCIKTSHVRRIFKVITHPDFNPYDTAGYNDIAIIILKKRTPLTDFIRPICLPKYETQAPARYSICGWGKTDTEIYSTEKLKADIPPFDKEECKEKYSKANITIVDTQICAGGEERDSCIGDSGGPLMMMSDDGTWYASGVVSYGMGCGMKGWPGIYTNIVKFLPWIKSQIIQNMSFKKKNKKERKAQEKN